MRLVGFSTGALALGDFRRGVRLLQERGVQAVELSALRIGEVDPLLDSLDKLDLTGFVYISFHAPSMFPKDLESQLAHRLQIVARRGWPIILHPDAVHDFSKWKPLGNFLLVENMDKRKRRGRTVSEMEFVFEQLPDASLCFDIGHARQVDPTMTEAALILKKFGSRLKQLHISDVNTQNTHGPLTYGSIGAFRQVAHLICADVPAVLECRLDDPEDILKELSRAEEALTPIKAAPHPVHARRLAACD